jgi:hypothetical protein
MIRADVDNLVKQLNQIHQDAVKKMTHMVYRFSIAIGTVAANRTPMGSSAYYPQYYQSRVTNPNWESYGLQPVSGFARGSWRLSVDGSLELQENYGRDSGDAALYSMENSFKDYDLGETIMISNLGPYIDKLERNYSKQTNGNGIIKPTVDQIMNVYQNRLKEYYERGA